MTTMQLKASRMVERLAEPPAKPRPKVYYADPVFVVDTLRKRAETEANEKAESGVVQIGRNGKPVEFSIIVVAACYMLGVTVEEFEGKCRHKRLILAREIAWTLGRQLTTLSFPQIAAQSKRPNHSTVITATQRFERTSDQLVSYVNMHTDKAGWLRMVKAHVLAVVERKAVRA